MLTDSGPANVYTALAELGMDAPAELRSVGTWCAAHVRSDRF